MRLLISCYIFCFVLVVVPDINATNNNGWTAVMFAARNGQKDAVECLIKNG